MTVKFQIVEQFEIEVPEQDPDEPLWYASWAIEQSGKMNKPVQSSWAMLRSLADFYDNGQIGSVVEYCGGIGAQSLMIQELFEPRRHEIMDWSEQATNHIRSIMPKNRNIIVRTADAYDPDTFQKANFQVLDIGDLKSYNLKPGTPQRGAFDRIFESQPLAVAIAEVSGIRLGLHRRLHEEFLGKPCPDYRTYLGHFFDFVEEVWGYAPVEIFHNGQFAKAALVPAYFSPERKFSSIPDSPMGLRVLETKELV